jgi:autotransporter-associated beta strand protein
LLAANNSTGTWNGTVTLNGAGTTNRIGVVSAGVGVTIFGQVTGSGGFESTAGVVDLEGAANDWAGDTLISGGTLRAGVTGALSPATTIVMNGGTLDLAGNPHPVAGLRGSAGTIQGAGTLFVNQSANTTYSGTFLDAGLNKLGTGSLTLTGASASTADNKVTAGTLLVNGSLPGSMTVDGGTLGGNGSVGPLVMNAGGKVAPGNSAGILGAGNTIFNGGTFALELNGPAAGTGYDQLNITGTFALAANAILTLTLGYDPADMVDSFVIVNNDGTEPITRTGFLTFNSQVLTEGASFTAGGQPFRITYAGGTNANDVVLQAIPEPASAASMFVGAGGLLLGMRRPRRR